jgi:hypothetical protein
MTKEEGSHYFPNTPTRYSAKVKNKWGYTIAPNIFVSAALMKLHHCAWMRWAKATSEPLHQAIKDGTYWTNPRWRDDKCPTDCDHCKYSRCTRYCNFHEENVDDDYNCAYFKRRKIREGE